MMMSLGAIMTPWQEYPSATNGATMKPPIILSSAEADAAENKHNDNNIFRIAII